MEVERVEHLTKIYGHGDAQTVALIDANLSVHSGELAVLLGPSGSSKTTLLTSICCINEPTARPHRTGWCTDLR